MRIEDASENEITSLADWAKLYDTPQASHQWKEGRSAHAAAVFVLCQNGANALRSRVSAALGKPVEFTRAVPEHEVRFDEYGRGRVHDIAIFGETLEGESVFVGVEAKVDETFGPTVLDRYLKAKAEQIAGTSTKAPERIEQLLAKHFQEPDPSMFDIRYQLLHATAGTLAVGADISVLFVAVFKTALYNESLGADNYRDYIQFMGKVGASPLKLPSKEALAHELVLEEKRLVCLYEHFEL